MLNQTIRRRVLLTGGSGTDSTTTDGAFPAGLAGDFAAGRGAALAGGAATSVPSSFKLLSNPKKPPGLCSAHTSAQGIALKYTIPRCTGIDVSVKTNSALFTRSAATPKES